MMNLAPHNSFDLWDALTALCDLLPQGVWLLDAQGRAWWANQRARSLCYGIQPDAATRQLAAHRAYDTKCLHLAITQVCAGGTRQTLCVARAAGLSPLMVSVVSLGGRGILAVCAVSPEDAPRSAPHVLCELYGLTPAEARFAGLLAEGHSLEEICQALNIQTGTARTHLKRIFHKTDTHRQGELVRLLLLGSGWFAAEERGMKDEG